MSTTIWEYPLEVIGEQWITMPQGSRILSVAVQGDAVCLWAAVDLEAPSKRQQIRIYGTGQPTDIQAPQRSYEPIGFIGTFMLKDGARVFHVFQGGYRLPGEESW